MIRMSEDYLHTSARYSDERLSGLSTPHSTKRAVHQNATCNTGTETSFNVNFHLNDLLQAVCLEKVQKRHILHRKQTLFIIRIVICFLPNCQYLSSPK